MNELKEQELINQSISSNEIKSISGFVKNLFKIKNPDEMLETAKKAGLKKTLGAFDLITLGVGAIIGSGIFTVIGIATVGDSSTLGAGPGLVLSMRKRQIPPGAAMTPSGVISKAQHSSLMKNAISRQPGSISATAAIRRR